MSTRRDPNDLPLPGFGPTRVFRAASMRDAFMRVKDLIGAEAVILSTRDLGRDAPTDNERFEVVAAWPSSTTESLPPRTERSPTLPDADRTRVSESRMAAGPARNTTRTDAALFPTEESQEEREERLTRQLRLLEQAVRGLEQQVQLLGSKGRSGDLLRQNSARLLEEGGPTATLIAAGLEPEIAAEIVDRAVRRAVPKSGLTVAKPPDFTDEIRRTIKTATALWSRPSGAVFALIGPSGAGKTTTLFKLAGLASFAHKRTVGLISTDTERLGAFESFQMYAEVMGLPSMLARDRGEVDQALDRFADMDLVLIDTPGHNPFDEAQRFWALKPVSGREVRHHLVLPATLSAGLVADTLATYDGPALESLIVTRLDEARGPSALIAACLRAELPLSHVATGREIPDDIRAADAAEIAHDLFRRAS
ncbi:MAG: hypothetical protein JNJ59_09355 [Deltaproteobacteria bacterium]|jgi:flagellar biosynthesis protein FlhF|nr:hypothetical protein [Deltaproteobacteria bacterium]